VSGFDLLVDLRDRFRTDPVGPFDERSRILYEQLLAPLVGLAPNLEQAQRYDGTVFRGQLLDMLKNTAASADAGYPANEDLQIDPETGVPSLKRHRRGPRRDSAAALEQQIKGRMPERSLLGIVSRTAYWLEWWRRFGPASGSDPKLKDRFGRYVITRFVYGSNMGPYEAARHMRGVSRHELFTAATQHASLDKLNEAITDVVNGHARLDLVQAWGNGTIAAADGTHVETWLDNLLAETSIRFGKAGGIGYHHVSDLYVALFTHFIRAGCGRPSISSKACCATPRRCSPRSCTPTPRARASRSTPSPT